MMNSDKIDQNIFSNLKNKLIGTLKADDDANNSFNSIDSEYENDNLILKEAYMSLLCAILDPSSHLRKNHNFQKKTFGKPTNCEECHAIVWGLQKQGFQCTKCYICIHEKCFQSFQLDCTEIRPNLDKNKTESNIEHDLTNRYEEIEKAFPNYFLKLNTIFKNITEDSKLDVKAVHQDYIQSKVKKTKIRLKIFIKNAINLMAKDSNGLSDPFVTVQCGLSKIKRTKTHKKCLNPVWNEMIEFEYTSTTEGILDEEGNLGDKIIVRVWDEDSGLKAHLDKMLTNESDDFLGQVILDANNLNFDVEQAHMLKGRTEDETVTGYLVFSLKMKFMEVNRSFSASQIFFERSKSVRLTYLDQYRILHRHIFKSMQTIFNEISNKNDYSWLSDCCISTKYSENDYQLIYFNDNLLDLVLKQFSNKYVVNEAQKKMIHLECFYDHFIDYFIQDYMKLVVTEKCEKMQSSIVYVNYNFDSNIKIFKFISYLVSSIDIICSSNRLITNDQTKSLNSLLINADLLVPYSNVSKTLELNVLENRHFWQKTCKLVNKIAYFLCDHHRFYSIFLDSKSQNRLSVCYELQEIVNLFKICCDFLHKNFESKTIGLSEKEKNDFFDVSKLKETLLDVNDEILLHPCFNTQNQFQIIQKCIEISIKNQFDRLFESPKQPNEESEEIGPTSSQSNSSSIARSQDGLVLIIDNLAEHKIVNDLQRLLCILTNLLPSQIETSSDLYADSFLSNYAGFENKASFKKIITRLFWKYFLAKIFQIIKNDTCSILKLKSSDVKLHLNLFLHINQFLIDNQLNNFTLQQMASYTFLNKKSTQTKLKYKSLNEYFQPFLIEYIRIQEDQFIRYITKIYDADKLTEIAIEIANMLNNRRVSIIQISRGHGRDCELKRIKTSNGLIAIENYCSPSVTDLFTILYQLLQIVLKFNSNDVKLNFTHELCFVNLVKSKLIAYSAHVKKEFNKVYRRNSRNDLEYSKEISKHFSNAFNMTSILTMRKKSSFFKSRPTTELTISSCILMNNYKRIIELLDEIEHKLTNESVADQLESIRDILEQDLYIRIEEYTQNFQMPLQLTCQFIQTQLTNETKANNDSVNLSNCLDNCLYDILNDKLIICKKILVSSIFKNMLEQIFKITIRCIEDSIILKRDSKLNSESIVYENSYFQNKMIKFTRLFSHNDDRFKENSLINSLQHKTIQSLMQRIVEFFSVDENCLNQNYLSQSIEYTCALKTLDLYLLSTNQLLSNFIRTQNMKQNNCNFGNSLGKIRLETEIKQNEKNKYEFDIKIKLAEARDLVFYLEEDQNLNNFPEEIKPFAEIYAFGPFRDKKKLQKKTFNCSTILHDNRMVLFKNTIFEFKIFLESNDDTLKDINDSSSEFLSNYEIQICLKDVHCVDRFKVIGIAVLNINELFKAAHVWKKLNTPYREESFYDFYPNKKDSYLFGKLDIWLALKSQLNINEEGNKILKVLDRYASDKTLLEFIQLKLCKVNETEN